MSQSNKFLLAVALVLVLATSAAFADLNIYLASGRVTGDVNIGAYSRTGEVSRLNGKVWDGSKEYVKFGPAPAPYPQVQTWEPGIEHLGLTASLEPVEVVRIDGITFPNHGEHWVANQEALVLFAVEIRDASSRLPSEFAGDLTLTLWVDWNGDKVWDKGETMVRDHINVQSYFPTSENLVNVFYLASFMVPDVDDIAVDVRGSNGGPSAQGTLDNELFYLWTRGIVSYDDPDVSPDGEQLFGEVEDYRVVYMKTPGKTTE